MSDQESRLMRAMRAANPGARDPAFVVAVLERAELERFKRLRLQAMLRGAGVAAALVGVAFALEGAAPTQALEDGLVATAALVLFVTAVRRTLSRI